MAHKIYTYDTSKTTGGRNTNKATLMIKQTEINLLENKKQAPFTGYSPSITQMKDSYVSSRTTGDNSNDSINLGKFVSHSDLEQRDKALTKFIQENVSKQINHAIDKFKNAGLKELVEKAVENQKEEMENLKKIVKSNEEIIDNLQNEKVNYEAALSKIEIVLERQFASVSHSYKEGKNPVVQDDESLNLLKEDIKNMQVNIKNLKETILTQINDQLTQGLSTLGGEQEKLQESMKNLLKQSNFNEKFIPIQQNIQNLEKNFSYLSENFTEVKEKQKGLEGRMDELFKILSEKKDGVVYEVNIADADRFKFMEGRIENCLSEIFKAKEQFEDTLNKKLDGAFDTYNKKQLEDDPEKKEKEISPNKQKPHIESVTIVTEREEKKEEIRNYVENVEEIKESERNLPILPNSIKTLMRNEDDFEKKDDEYQTWLSQNKAAVDHYLIKEGIKAKLEGGEDETISEIKQKDEDLNSEIQKDFESINKAMENQLKPEPTHPKTPEQKLLIKAQGSESIENDDDGEIVYNIDENGFLIDDKGHYILDDDGKMVKLSPEHIEYLRESNLYEEEFVTN